MSPKANFYFIESNSFDRKFDCFFLLF